MFEETSQEREDLLNAMNLPGSLVHRHVVGFEHFFEDCESVYILLELCTSQSMNELLRRRKRLHELEVMCYTVQMISALKYMHAHKVIHRDLKLGNLFLNDKMEVKIGDFGLATKLEFDGDRKRTICGTPNYIAPEILDGKTGHSYEVDVWSLGVIIYTLLIGKPPFETQDVKTTYQRIKKNEYSFPDHVKVSKQSKSLIASILQLDPVQRPSLDQILAHEFFRIGQSIPKHLPSSTLACPPSENYIRQFWPHLGRQGSAADLNKNKIDLNKENMKKGLGRDGLMTDRGGINRGSTLSPTGGAANDRRLSEKQVPSQMMVEWNDQEEAYIKQWINYSDKYGIGYLLTNETCGVYFNDNSKILLHPDNFSLEYFEKGLDKVEKRQCYNMKSYPQELKKKVTLLIHFKNYMEGSQSKSKLPQQKQNMTKLVSQNLVYVKRWLNTKHAILFRLSNKVVQVIFEDKSELVMSSLTKKVFYQNKKGEKCCYPLSVALDSGNAEMIKRLNYSRQVLEQSIKQQHAKPLGSALTQRISSNEARGGLQYQGSTQNLQQVPQKQMLDHQRYSTAGSQKPRQQEVSPDMIMTTGNPHQNGGAHTSRVQRFAGQQQQNLYQQHHQEELSPPPKYQILQNPNQIEMLDKRQQHQRPIGTAR
eukprot:403331651